MDTSRHRGGAGRDAILYAASCLAAIVVLRTSDGPLDLQWAEIALVGYGAGALAAWAVSRRGASLTARVILGASVFIAVVVVPTVLNAGARAGSGATPVKSDVLVVEQAAGSLLDGRNPYAVVHDEGPLATWPAWAQDHYPYLGALLAAGAARALAGPVLWTDPLVLTLGFALAAAVPSILLLGASMESRLRTFLVLFVLASGAPLIVTSGKEILVLALLLASLVALQRRHPTLSGIAAGSAAAMHQLAWVVLPIYAFLPAKMGGRRVAAVAATLAGAPWCRSSGGIRARSWTTPSCTRSGSASPPGGSRSLRGPSSRACSRTRDGC